MLTRVESERLPVSNPWSELSLTIYLRECEGFLYHLITNSIIFVNL